ncbi:tRNA (adenosine(37)-N6)-threonylcarbamoyltransferase complex ATPase subunit type 1 TsaE [Spiroplasma turonicum]|nr:tRNA (adenosine(37)-N6)-threonylcarbamoyltransferase complex ATPase subunit type 1 TsaE [Spiroplasma turonicum]
MKCVINDLTQYFKENIVFLLCGEMGSGKTTFVKNFLYELGVKELVTSPTFTIMNQYELNGFKINHLDAYRLTTNDDAEPFLEEMINSFNLVEWPENLNIDFKEYFKVIKINILIIDNDSRMYIIEEG